MGWFQTLMAAGMVGNAVLPPTGLLRTAAANNAVSTGVLTNASCDVALIRLPPYVIGTGDLSELRVSNFSWYLTTSTLGNLSSLKITEMAIENENETISVPVTYGGSRSKTLSVALGNNDIQSDPIYPSAFGLSKFTRGEKYWLKIRIDSASLGISITTCDAVPTTTFAGSQVILLDKSQTTITASVDALGPFVTSGGAPVTSNVQGYRPVLLGKYIDGRSDLNTWIAFGDSVISRNDDTDTAPYGMGFFTRAMLTSAPVSGINWAKVQGNAQYMTSPGTVTLWSKYANNMIEEYGLNDFGVTGTGITTANMQTRLLGLWSTGRGYGIQKIIRTRFIGNGRNNSTDNWTTEANQTVRAGWEPVTGAGAVMNAWFDTQVGSTIDMVMPMQSVLGTTPGTWKVNGTANWPTKDGTHPSPDSMIALAYELRGIINSMYP